MTVLAIHCLFSASGGRELPYAAAFTEPPYIPVAKPTPTNTVTVCSSGCDYRTLEQADQAAQPGWLIKVKAGTYSCFDWNTDGTQTNPIVIESYGDGDVAIQCSGDWTQFYGDNLIIDGGPNREIIFKGPSSTVSSDSFAVYFKSTNVLVSRVEITDDDKQAQGVMLKGNGNKLFNNYIHDNTQEGIYVKDGNNHEIRNNLFIDCRSGGVQFNPHNENENVNNVVVSGNAFNHNGYDAPDGDKGGMQIYLGSDGHTLSNVYVYNNLFWDNKRSGISISKNGGTIRDVYIYNNGVYDNGEEGIITKISGVGTLINNIVFSNARGDIVGSFKQTSNNLQSNPGLLSTNPSSPDFLKLSSSATSAIDQGTDLYSEGVTNDYFGNSRGSQPDIGAHEYTGTAPSPPLVGDVNNNGTVDTQDIQACINHFLSAQDYGTAADVNQDGSVDVLDVQEIANIILG